MSQQKREKETAIEKEWAFFMLGITVAWILSIGGNWIWFIAETYRYQNLIGLPCTVIGLVFLLVLYSEMLKSLKAPKA